MAVRRTKQPSNMTAEEFRRVREQVLQLSQQELGQRMGIGGHTIYRYESGRLPITEDRATHLRDLVALQELREENAQQAEQVLTVRRKLGKARARLRESA